MSSIAIVVGFAVMLFLPCAIALMGGREPKRKKAEEFSPYSDRVVNAVVKPVPPVIEGAPIAKTNAMAALTDLWPEVRDPSLHARDVPASTRDLAVHGWEGATGVQQVQVNGGSDLASHPRDQVRTPHTAVREPQSFARETNVNGWEQETYSRESLNKYLGRVEQAELEVLQAKAVAARAQADALAAVARAAIMQAEAAAAAADDLEDDATEALREGRRAA